MFYSPKIVIYVYTGIGPRLRGGGPAYVRAVGDDARRRVPSRSRGRVAAERNSIAGARAHWRAALDRFETVGAPQDILAVAGHLIETALEEGDRTRAEALCRRARDELETRLTRSSSGTKGGSTNSPTGSNSPGSDGASVAVRSVTERKERREPSGGRDRPEIESSIAQTRP